MASIAYEIDPGGDLDLVLKDPNTQRIVPIVNKEDAISNDEFDNPPLVGRYEIFNEACDGEMCTEGASVSNPGGIEAPAISEVRMRVSSRHLILASRTFRKMFEGNWSESSSAAIESGRRQIQTSGWDAAALAIVLDAIHGRHRDIPKCTTLGLLTRIATIVDYYECHESVHLIVDIWLSTLPDGYTLTSSCNQSSLLWLYISWVFSKSKISSPITTLFLRKFDGLTNIDLFDLPLGGVLGIISTKRQEFVGRLITGLENLRKTLSVEEGCTAAQDPNCSANMLGVLIRWQQKLELLDPQLAAPYRGHSFSSLRTRINLLSKSRPGKGIKSCSCTVWSRLSVVMSQIELDIRRFDVTTEQGRKG